MSDGELWTEVEPLLASVERPSRYTDREWGARSPEGSVYRSVLLYPDVYEVGQANQAIGILYDRLNSLDGVSAERVYVPWVDFSALMRERGIPLFSLESCTPVREFDLLGITLPYELTYTNILEALDLAGVPLLSSERSASDPLVVGGGPCAFNPEPVAAFFDAILIGEGEEAVVEIVGTHRRMQAAGAARSEVLAALAQVPGVYVPSLYRSCGEGNAVERSLESDSGAPLPVVKRVLTDLSDTRTPVCPVVPFMDVVHDRMTVEVLRGCTRGCRFCQAGMVYRPVRERSADEIVRDALAGLACTGYDEVSLTSLSTADYSLLEDVLRRLTRRLAGSGISVSLPSLRVDAFSVDMARMIASSRKTGLTFAPEAGSQRLRDVINKNVTEEDLMVTVGRAFEAGWRRVKLYFMIGLPTETDDDLRGISELVTKVLEQARAMVQPSQRGGVKIAVSISTFVPKSHTPFQWEAQISHEEVLRRQSVVREGMPRKGVDLSWHDADVSFLEGVIARGGRELSAVIVAAWKAGARFDAWSERFSLALWRSAFAECGLDPEGIANAERVPGEPLPWSHISAGVSERYLMRERARAFEARTTADCSFSGCTGCDVCGDLGVDVLVAGGVRR